MTDAFIVAGGRVVCPTAGLDGILDVYVDGGRITRLAPAAERPAGAPLFDATGMLVLPGFIDIGVTLRDPGFEDDETLTTLLAAAAAGGYTAVAGLASTVPTADTGAVVAHLLARAANTAGAALLVVGALTRGRGGTELADLGDMASAGAVAFSDAPHVVTDALVLRHALSYAATFARPVLLRPRVPALESGVVREGPVATRLGLGGIPDAAELIETARIIALTRLTGAVTHIGPLSTHAAWRLVQSAANDGLPVTASVAVHTLLADETLHRARPYDVALRLDPPLSDAADRTALVEALAGGALSVVSAHRASSPRHKDVEFERAVAGASMLPACALALRGLDDAPGFQSPGLSPSALAAALAGAPAAALGLTDRGRLTVGARADLVLIDPQQKTPVPPVAASARDRRHPLAGAILGGRIRATVVGGTVVYRQPSDDLVDASRAR